EDLEQAVAGIARELDVREPPVRDRTQKPQPKLEDLGLESGLEHGTRSEVERALPDLAADDAGKRFPLAPDVREERVDVLVGVGNELLYDELEAVRLGFAPDVDGLLVARRDDGLLPEGECILLPFDRLQKVRRLEPAVRERLGAVHRERLRRRDACFRGFRRTQVLAAQTPDALRVRRTGPL